MAKLTKQQKRNKKLKAKKKKLLTEQQALNRDQKSFVTAFNPSVDIATLNTAPLLEAEGGPSFFVKLEPAPKDLDHQPIFNLYKEAGTASARGKLLNDYDEKYDVVFDPELLLELIVDEIKDNNDVDEVFLEILDSQFLAWHEIQSEIKARGFVNEAELMTPVMVFFEYDLE